MTTERILALLPRFLLIRYEANLRRRLDEVETKIVTAKRLLKDVEEGYEYTQGYRAHLGRCVEEGNKEGEKLINSLYVMQKVLSS